MEMDVFDIRTKEVTTDKRGWIQIKSVSIRVRLWFGFRRPAAVRRVCLSEVPVPS